jgi:hypothetical protein
MGDAIEMTGALRAAEAPGCRESMGPQRVSDRRNRLWHVTGRANSGASAMRYLLPLLIASPGRLRVSGNSDEPLGSVCHC